VADQSVSVQMTLSDS